jgi:hypothetical protein
VSLVSLVRVSTTFDQQHERRVSGWLHSDPFRAYAR